VFRKNFCQLFAYLDPRFVRRISLWLKYLQHPSCHQSLQATMLGYTLFSNEFLEVAQSQDLFFAPVVGLHQVHPGCTLFLSHLGNTNLGLRHIGLPNDPELLLSREVKVRYQCRRCPEDHCWTYKLPFAFAIAFGRVTWRDYLDYQFGHIVRQSLKPFLRDSRAAHLMLKLPPPVKYSHLCHNKTCSNHAHGIIESRTRNSIRTTCSMNGYCTVKCRRNNAVRCMLGLRVEPASPAAVAMRGGMQAMRTRAFTTSPICPNCGQSLPLIPHFLEGTQMLKAGHLMLNHLKGRCG
jgi:hypothetical protein